MTTQIDGVGAGRPGDHDHAAFGLTLQVDPGISIPGLMRSASPGLARPPSRVHLNPDALRERWRDIDTAPVRTRELRAAGALARTVDFAEPAGYLLWARDHGRVLISSDGLELLCEADPTNENWASIVYSQALPLAATLRGFEVFHACGVVLDGRAVLIAGPSGAGKSSLAAALVRAGLRLLSDDVVALRLRGGKLIAYPGPIALQLREDENKRLSAEERAMIGRPKQVSAAKQRYVGSHVPEPVPLGSLFLIERSAAEPAAELLEAANPFALLASTFNLAVRTPARLRYQLDVVSAIASAGMAHRLRVQPGVDATQSAEIIRDHLAAIDASGAAQHVVGAETSHRRLPEL
jgi:hypothetical protein